MYTQPTEPTDKSTPSSEHNIDMGMLIEEWGKSQTYTKQHTSDFPSLDTIVDGEPLDSGDDPYVGDTTIAGLVRQIPRESVQQLPIFGVTVNGTKNSLQAHLCSYVLRRGVFNEDTFGKGLLSTIQLGGEQALSHGYAPFMVASGTMFSEFGTTMKLMHYSDVGVEPGISDAYESCYFYVTTNLTPTRVKKIRDNAKDNPNTTWIVEALDRVLDSQPTTNQYSLYQSSALPDVSRDAPTYTFVTRKETGKGGKFVTFCPQVSDTPLRVLKNKSKFGYPRVNFLVIDPAALIPFGKSRVRLAAPNQNFANIYYASVASMLILNSKPPILQRGRFAHPPQLKRNAVWKTLDTNATVELKELSNSSLDRFPEVLRQTGTQIQNMMGKPTRGTDLGNTSPGAKQQIKYEDTSTNQITNIMENFLRQYGLVALDTYICEQTVEVENPEAPNEEVLIVDDECKNAINRVGEADFVPVPDLEADPLGDLGVMTTYIPIIGKDNKITVNWNELYDFVETWRVDIELSMGKDELEEKTRGDLQDMLVTMTQNKAEGDVEKEQKINEIEDRLLEKAIPDSKRMDPTPLPPPTPPPVNMGNQVTMSQ